MTTTNSKRRSFLAGGIAATLGCVGSLLVPTKKTLANNIVDIDMTNSKENTVTQVDFPEFMQQLQSQIIAKIQNSSGYDILPTHQKVLTDGTNISLREYSDDIRNKSWKNIECAIHKQVDKLLSQKHDSQLKANTAYKIVGIHSIEVFETYTPQQTSYRSGILIVHINWHGMLRDNFRHPPYTKS